MKTKNVIARECGLNVGDEVISGSLCVIAREKLGSLRCDRSNPVEHDGIASSASQRQPHLPRNDTSFNDGAKKFFVIMLLCVLSVSLQAQSLEPRPQKTIIGVWGDLLYNHHSTNFNFFPSVDVCGKFTSGDGLKPSGGLFTDLPLSQKLHLYTSLGYRNYSGTLSAPPVDSVRRVINGSGITIDREHHLSANINAFSLQALAEWKTPWKFDVSFGPQVSLLAKKPTYLQTEQILSPDGTVWSDNGEPIDTLAQGEIPNASSVLLSGVARVSYPIVINKNFTAFPEAQIFFPLTKFSSPLSWNISSYALGVGIGYTLPEPQPAFMEFPVVLPPPQPTPKKMYALDAALTVSGLDAQGNRVPAPAIYIGKTIINEEIALVPAVFFDSASALIPSRYKSRNETSLIIRNPDSLGAVDALDVAHDILNVIGQRMREHPLAHLKLSGASGTTGVEKKNIDLAKRRVQSVKEYLINAWSIDPARINVDARELPQKPSNTQTRYGREENRRVDISSDDYEIIKPFATSAIVKRYVSPPGLLLEPRYIADTTVTSWNINISTKSAELVHLGTDDVNDLVRLTHKWIIDPNKIHDEDDSVSVTLLLEDELGQAAKSRAEIEVTRTWEKSSHHNFEKFDNVHIERFNVITFEFDKGKLLESEKRRLEHAVLALDPDATLQVSGYADLVTGDIEYNKKLSGERAHDVSKIITDQALKDNNTVPKKVFVEAEGAKDLYDNALPEGRFLSRTVKIEIVKPLR